MAIGDAPLVKLRSDLDLERVGRYRACSVCDRPLKRTPIGDWIHVHSEEPECAEPDPWKR